MLTFIRELFIGLWGLTLEIILFPIKRLHSIVRYLRDEYNLKNYILVVCNLFSLVVYFLCVLIIYMSLHTFTLVKLGSVIGVLAKDKVIVYDGPSEFTDSGITGGGSFGGQEFEFDFDTLPEHVDLPSNYYQAGTVRQRAELLVLVQEICARPEINLKPEELLGVFYVEQGGSFHATTSLISSTLPEEFNSAGYGGPFQHGKDTFNSPKSMKEIQGRAYISMLEDSTLSADSRVKDLNSVGDLTTPDGLTRPNIFYFPDAMYSTAYRLSSYKDGLYNGVIDTGAKPVFDWIQNLNASEAVKDFIKFNNAVARYSGYLYPIEGTRINNCCVSWMPSMYVDLINSKGSIDQWSDLATSRTELISNLSGGRGSHSGTAYHEGAGLIGSLSMLTTPVMKPHNHMSSYAEYWRDLSGRHLPTHYYGYTTINGGKWIYEGLLALGSAVGKPVGGGDFDPTDIEGYICPLNFDKFVVTSRYHEDRHTYSHRGVDVDTGTGDPIYSPRDGVVTRAGWDSACNGGKNPNVGGGKMVFIKFDNGVETRVMHLNEISVVVGQSVKQGDVLGKTGNTGGSTGDHLHIELWKNGTEFDPTFLFTGKPITYLN